FRRLESWFSSERRRSQALGALAQKELLGDDGLSDARRPRLDRTLRSWRARESEQLGYLQRTAHAQVGARAPRGHRDRGRDGDGDSRIAQVRGALVRGR